MSRFNNGQLITVKSRTKYTTYEYTYTSEFHGDVIILANINDKDNPYKDGHLLEISLKTSANSGMAHFIVGFKIDDDSELAIRKEIVRLAENEYYETSVNLAIEEEEKLENMFMEDN